MMWECSLQLLPKDESQCAGVGVFDVVGAGDTFLSALVYFYLIYGKIEEAIPYANKAAAIAVTHFGTYVLTERDVNEVRG